MAQIMLTGYVPDEKYTEYITKKKEIRPILLKAINDKLVELGLKTEKEDIQNDNEE